MRVVIEYCVQWNYEPRALSLREELGKAFPDIISGHIPGARGSFEVIVDDVLVFSKLELDRFPEEGEIINLIRS